MNLHFLSAMQVPLHRKFKTQKLMTCLESKYRFVIHCPNNANVLNEHKLEQPKLRVLERLTDRNDYDIKRHIKLYN